MNRQTQETMQQYRGRQKRETNAANDALNLKVGEPVRNGSYSGRFNLTMIDRHRPTRLRRLEGEELAAFLLKEKEQQARRDAIREAEAARDALYASPEGRDAAAILHILDEKLFKIIDKLTPTEWAELRKKLDQ